MLYILGIFFVFVEKILHAWANIFDGFLSNHVFERLPALIFFSQFVSLLFLPLVFVIDFPTFIPASLWGVVLAIALIEILYQYPYYWSLRSTDTSVVTSLFSLGKIFVPLLAFFIVHEQLSDMQYIGFFALTISSMVLTFDVKKFRLNRAFVLMLFVSIVLSIQAILYKFLFEHGVSWGSVLVWTAFVEFIMAAICILTPENLREIKKTVELKKVKFLFIAQSLTWGGEAAVTYALYLIPVSVVTGVGSAQPIFVFLFALLFAKRYPKLFKEQLSDGKLKKVICFTLMIVGTLMIAIN